jgi:GAF domain-containing protein
MQDNNLEALLKAQARVLNAVASGQPLDVCLDTICLEIERLSDVGAKASILILQGDRLVHGAGPSLPTAYQEAINGVEIGDNVGSCGTAAFLKQPVYVDDIASSVQWQDFSQLAAKYRLKACWSTPIMSSKGKVLGTFAMYFDHIKKPEKHHLDLIVFFHSLTALTIERDLLYQRKTELSETIQSHANKLQAFARVMPDLAFVLDEDGNYVDIFGADEKLLYDELSKLIGVSLSDVFDEEHTRQYMSVIRSALRTEEVQEYEYTLVVPKGEIVF